MKTNLALAGLALNGCIMIDQGEKPTWLDTAELADQEHEEPVAQPEPEREPVHFSLSPDSAPPDTTFIAALRAEDRELNWTLIQSILAYGDIHICELQPIYDELLLTIHVPADAEEGSVDLVIEYADGDADFLENGLVIDEGADIFPAEVNGACD